MWGLGLGIRTWDVGFTERMYIQGPGFMEKGSGSRIVGTGYRRVRGPGHRGRGPVIWWSGI